MLKYSSVYVNSIVLAVLFSFHADAGSFNGTSTGENGTISSISGTIDLSGTPLVDLDNFIMNFWVYSYCASVLADATYTCLSNPVGTYTNLRSSYIAIGKGCLNLFKGCVNLCKKGNVVQKNIQDGGENNGVGLLIWHTFDEDSIEEEISNKIGKDACMLLVEQVNSAKLVYALLCLKRRNQNSQESNTKIKDVLERKCYLNLMNVFKEILNTDNICEVTIGKIENKVDKKWYKFYIYQIKAISEIYTIYLMNRDEVDDDNQYGQEKTQAFLLLSSAFNKLLTEGEENEDVDESNKAGGSSVYDIIINNEQKNDSKKHTEQDIEAAKIDDEDKS
jgi:hypothetical protein